ncbi:hypothetical protein JCM11491_006306 [Sporobolomyces phaffii]
MSFKREHAALVRDKDLLGASASQGPLDWRTELVRAVSDAGIWVDASKTATAKRKETVKRLVEGAATPRSNTPTVVPDFLRQLSGATALRTSSPDFYNLIRLAEVLLRLRQLDARVFGELLDPNAQAVLAACRDFRLHTQHSHDNPALLPRAMSSGLPRIRISPDATVEPSAEQATFINSPRTPGITLLIAHAGTGKSTACLGLAQAVGLANVFSGFVLTRRIKDELNHKFGRLGEFRTIDSLAYRILVTRYGSSFLAKFRTWDEEGSELRELNYDTVGTLLGIRGKWMPNKYRRARSNEVDHLLTKRYRITIFAAYLPTCPADASSSTVAKILDTFQRWCQSSRHDITASDVRAVHPGQINVPAQELVEMTKRLARRVHDMDDAEAPIPFYAMKKHLAVLLHRPSLDYDYKLQDLIIIDEAQDLNDCELEMLVKFGEKSRLVLVGDPLQALYHEVENRTNLIKLAPRYVDLFMDVLPDLQHRPYRLLLSSRFDKRHPFRLFFHGAHLFLGGPFENAPSRDPFPRHNSAFSSALAEFRTWQDFIDEYTSWADDLPRSAKYDDWKTLRMVFEASAGENITGSIVYQVKGLEFDSVVLSTSFGTALHEPISAVSSGSLHVAMTRAKDDLELNPSSTRALATAWGLHRFYLVQPRPGKTTSDPTCNKCSKKSALLIGYSTPLSFHPSHVHSTTTDDSDSAPRRDGIDPSEFPVCTSCAARSTYAPLHDFVEFLTRCEEGEDEGRGNEGVCDDEPTIDHALAERSMTKMRREGNLDDELSLTAF